MVKNINYDVSLDKVYGCLHGKCLGGAARVPIDWVQVRFEMPNTYGHPDFTNVVQNLAWY